MPKYPATDLSQNARQFITRNHDNLFKQVFIHGQALTFLASELKHVCPDDRQDTEKLNLQDMNTAQAAKDILLCEFRNPPSSMNYPNGLARIAAN